MKTIKEHDFVISVVSSAYIKSLNCMYEVMQLMQDKDYQVKLFFIIVSRDDVDYYNEKNRYDGFEAKIYDVMDRLKYVTYWRDKKAELERSINEAGSFSRVNGQSSSRYAKVKFCNTSNG